MNQNGLKLNGTHQLLAYADDVNILGGNAHTVKKNAEALIVATKEIGLEVNADNSETLPPMLCVPQEYPHIYPTLCRYGFLLVIFP